MTPQESQLVADLFDRLAKLETQPRDATAERLIADGAARAPHALYALVQTTLVQDEALRRANAVIEDLQAQVDGAPQSEPEQKGFLDSMREAFGGNPRPSAMQRSPVPGVRAGAAPQTPYQQQAQPGYVPQPGGAPPSGGGGSLGGSFLGTAASAAAGVVGGALLLDGIRSMFGHQGGFGTSSAFADAPRDRLSPWNTDKSTAGSAADSDLARQAGIDHIGDAARRDANADSGSDKANNLFGNDDDFANTSDADYDDNGFNDEDDFGDADAGADSDGTYDA